MAVEAANIKLDIMSRFKDVNIAVVGDYYLDEFIHGYADKFSPEAPVARVVIDEKRHNPGCAGNTACNITALGGKAYAVGIIGQDSNGQILKMLLKEAGVNTDALLEEPSRLTGTYSRLLVAGKHSIKQQVVRFDVENKEAVPAELQKRLLKKLDALMPRIQAIIVADYDEAQGTCLVTKSLLKSIAAIAKKHSKLLVGYSRENIADFKGFSLLIPNDHEAGAATRIKVTSNKSAERAAAKLMKMTHADKVIITRAEQGMTLLEKNRAAHIPSFAREVVEVSGAGDTATSAITLALSLGSTLSDSAILGSLAAAVSIAKQGTATASPQEIRGFAGKLFREPAQPENGGNDKSKIRTPDELSAIVADLKKSGRRVVFANGCFDPLHVGHINLLLKAKEIGGVLIVAINSDYSVKVNKGYNRPFLNQEKRAELLSALEAVDYVTIFPELTPIKLLSRLKPDILVKGDNYTPDEVVGKEIVEKNGGKIAILPVLKSIPSEAALESVATIYRRHEAGPDEQ